MVTYVSFLAIQDGNGNKNGNGVSSTWFSFHCILDDTRTHSQLVCSLCSRYREEMVVMGTAGYGFGRTSWV